MDAGNPVARGGLACPPTQRDPRVNPFAVVVLHHAGQPPADRDGDMPGRTASEFRIRAARVEDRPRLLDVWERSVRATHRFLGERDIATLRPLVADELASDALGWWVLTSVDDEPIGFLGYARAAIEALFLDPSFHGRRGGTILVGHAQGLSGGTLTVDVNEANEGARRFYEALGFSVVGRSTTDSAGRPFPILHMKRPAPNSSRDA